MPRCQTIRSYGMPRVISVAESSVPMKFQIVTRECHVGASIFLYLSLSFLPTIKFSSPRSRWRGVGSFTSMKTPCKSFFPSRQPICRPSTVITSGRRWINRRWWCYRPADDSFLTRRSFVFLGVFPYPIRPLTGRTYTRKISRASRIEQRRLSAPFRERLIFTHFRLRRDRVKSLNMNEARQKSFDRITNNFLAKGKARAVAFRWEIAVLCCICCPIDIYHCRSYETNG